MELESQELIYQPYWNATSPFTPDRDGKRKAVVLPGMASYFGTLLGRDVSGVEPDVVGHGVFNVVYGLKFAVEDGPDTVARIRYNFTDSESAVDAAREVTESEVGILGLLARAVPHIPVPRVLAYNSSVNNDINTPFILEERIRGISLGQMTWDESLQKSFSMETFVPEFCEALSNIFSIQLEVNKIGVLTSWEKPYEVGGFAAGHYSTSGGPFECLEDYLRWRIIDCQSWESIPDAPVDLEALKKRVLDLAGRLVRKLSPELLEVCLVHCDPHERNCLVNGSQFAGIIDWEAHEVLPACLAAAFPIYLRHDGMYDPRYAKLNEYGGIRLMHGQLRPDAVTSAKLRSQFLPVAESKAPVFAKALTEGSVLRQLLEWVTFVEWEGDAVWAGFELWERDQRDALCDEEGRRQ